MDVRLSSGGAGDPDAFAFTAGSVADQSLHGANAFYFSFITLCTVGYGDIVPVSHEARMLAAMEAITSVSKTDVYFTYAGGMGNLKLKNLSPDLQEHFRFGPTKAKAVELRQAENEAKDHEQLFRQPVAQAPDAAREPAAAPRATAVVWRIDSPGALKRAQSENKLVLLDFTGSDWCPWCINLDRDVLSAEELAAFAKSKPELVKVDFPRHTPLSHEQARANEALAKQFLVDGYPTYVLLNADGNELGRQVGYLNGGADAFNPNFRHAENPAAV